MSERTLQSSVLAKFSEAFGQPHASVNSDTHWSLRRFAYRAAVNVLVNSAEDDPIVWVFNPHDPSDGVFHIQIKSEMDIDSLIQRILGIVAGGQRNGNS